MDRETLIERARGLTATLKARAVDCEAARRCPDETIADLISAGLAKIVQPARFGGFELGWDVHCEVMMELAEGCASQAWVAMILSDHKYILGAFPEQAQADVCDADREALICASLFPQGIAKRVDGGVVATGRFGFASGVHHAHWVFAGVTVEGTGDGIGEGASEPCLLLVPAGDIELIDNWHVVGLAGTGSLDFELRDVFVPAHRAVPIRALREGEGPGGRLHAGAVYRMPQRAIAALGIAAPSIGIARRVIDDFTAWTRDRVSRGNKVAEWQSVQLRIAESAAEAEAARLMLVTAARDAMATLASGARLTTEQRTRARRDAAFAVMLARRAVDRLFDASGAHGLYLDGDLQRGMRDAKAAAAHVSVSWDGAGSNYGRAVLGLEPEPGTY